MHMHVESCEKMPLLRIKLPTSRRFPSHLGLEVFCYIRDLLKPIAGLLEIIQCRFIGWAARFHPFCCCDVLGTHSKN